MISLGTLVCVHADSSLWKAAIAFAVQALEQGVEVSSLVLSRVEFWMYVEWLVGIRSLKSLVGRVPGRGSGTWRF